MCRFIIRYRNGNEKEYRVDFNPWPTFGMLEALAKAILREKGGCCCEFSGPNGLRGYVER